MSGGSSMVRWGIVLDAKSAWLRDLSSRIRSPDPPGGAWITMSTSTLFHAGH